MTNNKTGVTSLILAIGVMIIIAMTLVIGLKIFSFIIKEEPAVIAKEFALTGMTVLAAPEDVVLTAKAPAFKERKSIYQQVGIGGPRKTIAYFGKVNFMRGTAEGVSLEKQGFWETFGTSMKFVIPIYGAYAIGSDMLQYNACYVSGAQGECSAEVAGVKIRKAITEFNKDENVFVQGEAAQANTLFIMRAHCDACWSEKNYAVLNPVIIN